jgi:hypothetical protein
MDENGEIPQTLEQRKARREFLARCGRFAAVTPPAMTMLLTVAATPNEAYASTILGGGKPKPKPKPRPKPKKS